MYFWNQGFHRCALCPYRLKWPLTPKPNPKNNLKTNQWFYFSLFSFNPPPSAALPSAILTLRFRPYQRGIDCSDSSINYPYRKDTISHGTMAAVTITCSMVIVSPAHTVTNTCSMLILSPAHALAPIPTRSVPDTFRLMAQDVNNYNIWIVKKDSD